MKNNKSIKKKKSIKDLNKLLKDKTKEVTKHKGKYYLLHILKNGRPVPLYFSDNLKDIEKQIKIRNY